jgi:hypothetical protein
MDSFGQNGKAGNYKGRGIWVPPGLTAEEIGVCAEALMRELGDFLELRSVAEARQIVTVVLAAARSI